MTIRTKLLLAFSISTLLLAAIGVFGLFRLSVTNAYATRLVDNTVPMLVIVEQMSANLSRYRTLQASHIAVKNDTDQTAIEQALDQVDRHQRELISAYSTAIEQEPNNQAEREAAIWLDAQWGAFVKRSQTTLIPTSRQHISITAYAVYGSMDGDYQNLSNTIDGLVEDVQADMRHQQDENDALQDQSRAIVAGATLFGLFCSVLLWRLLSRSITRNIDQLVKATRLVASGTYDQPVDARGSDELAQLARSFNQMQTTLHDARLALEAERSTLAGRTQELECTLDELRAATHARDELSETVRSLESPVLPVMEGVLVMPLSGSIDSSRALAVTESQLAAIERLGAHTVIVDVTGVPIVDTAVAGALVRTAEAARLLGAETVLVGLRPELAQTIVGLGVDLGRLVTRADLADGVRYALSRRTRLAQATSAG
jgi:anti-anti-sigma factor